MEGYIAFHSSLSHSVKHSNSENETRHMEQSKRILSICLKLWIKERFWEESEIIANVDKIVELIESGTVDLLRTQGAVSIIFEGEELLGTYYLTDVHLILNDIFFSLADLANGKTVERYLPGQPATITLTIKNSVVNYKLFLRTSSDGKPHIHKKIPVHLFITTFTHFYLRNAKLFKILGQSFKTLNAGDLSDDDIVGHDFGFVLNDWKSHLALKHISDTELNELMTMSLDAWIRQERC